MKVFILDPGHGLGNKKAGVFDPGAVSNNVREADIAMEWANELRAILLDRGHKVIRTRVSNTDPAPIGKRAGIAKQYGGDVMLSIHCNAADGTASGSETFYRGTENRVTANRLNDALVGVLGTKNRGAKTEKQSQHSTLAVMAFQPCFLIELGFIDHAGDRAKMLDPTLRREACEAIAGVIS